MILTNDFHHLIWLSFSFDGYVQQVRGTGFWILIGYGYLLVALHVITLLWLFVRSPLHRWPVGLILLGRLLTATAYFLGATNRNPFAPMDLTILTVNLSSGLYTLALFRFRMLDLIPVARETVIEQMREGMLVLDAQRRIVERY